MMIQSTPSIDFPEYMALLEAQRKCLVELMTPCDYPEYPTHPKEPHAYHSDDTYDDLRSALEIYSELIDHLIDGPESMPGLSVWFTEQAKDAINQGLDEGFDNDFDEPMPNFACDAITSEFQTIYTRFYKAVKAQG